MAAAIALPVTLFAIASWLDWNATSAAADREILRTLDVAHEHALKVFETVDLSLTETEEVVRGMSDDEIAIDQGQIHRRLGRLADALPQIKSLWLFDPQGRALVNSVDPAPTVVDFSDRDYFRVHVARPDISPFVGPVLIPRAPFAGAPFFSVSRRRTADGFIGVVQASVLPDYFEKFYERIAQDAGMFFALGLTDGNIIARFPSAKAPIRIDPTQPAAKKIARRPSSGILTSVTPSDGIERRMAYRRMDPYPIYVAAGLSTEAIADRWRAAAINHILIGVPLTAIVFGLLAMALRRTEQLYVEAAKRREAEDHLHRGQRLEAMGHMTSGVAHDFNNLLTVVGASAEMLGKMDLSPERRQRYVAAISDTVRRATVLTDRLLRFSRSRRGDASVIDVGACLTSVSDIVRTLCGYRIEVVIKPAATALRVCADESQFETAIINLAANARDAMSGVGRLHIAVIEMGSGTFYPPSLDVGRSYARISVGDTGSGIEAHDIDHIFEPFFTTKDAGKGTGLGLSQVSGFAREAGGDVSVESLIGEGSTFHLYLPLIDDRKSDDVSTEVLVNGV